MKVLQHRNRFMYEVFFSGTYWEPSQISKIECFTKIVNDSKQLVIFAKSFILDIWLGSEYASANFLLFGMNMNFWGSYKCWGSLKYLSENLLGKYVSEQI